MPLSSHPPGGPTDRRKGSAPRSDPAAAPRPREATSTVPWQDMQWVGFAPSGSDSSAANDDLPEPLAPSPVTRRQEALPPLPTLPLLTEIGGRPGAAGTVPGRPAAALSRSAAQAVQAVGTRLAATALAIVGPGRAARRGAAAAVVLPARQGCRVAARCGKAARTAMAAMAGRCRAVVSRRLLPPMVAAAAVAALAAVLYYGGERLAGAMPRLDARLAAPPASETGGPDSPTRDSATRDSAASNPAKLYRREAQAGDPAAQYNLGILYAQGTGVPRDYTTAAAWFRKAAQGGIREAQFNLGVLYADGLGVAKAPAAAAQWYLQAALRNDPAAEFNLARAYADGRGVPQDWVAAARWYHEAALQGLVAAMVNFAIIYEKGEGVGRSLPDAYAWYRAAARRGDTVAAARAQHLFDGFGGGQKADAVIRAAAIVDALHDAATQPSDLAAGPMLQPAGPPPVLMVGGSLAHTTGE